MGSVGHDIIVGLIGAAVAALGILGFLVTRKNAPPPQTIPVDQQAVDQVNQALIERAKAEAAADEEKQQIAKIEQIKDSAAKLKALADALKGA